ncbi:MAG: thiamine-phosphate kinase [Acidobacteria bacterium]|nr:thiamine-phosphate kinase [Acidobacteriota bacterium]
MPSEFDFIKAIQQKAAAQSAADLVLGIGDDAAVWREQAGRETLITVDLLVEDVDFKLAYAPPRWLGHKALAVSLSDIAAMGGAPKFALLTLAIPPTLTFQTSAPATETFWQEFFAGYFSLAETYGVQLIGGDISSAPERLTIDSIVIGHCAAGRAVRRNGAKSGDAVFVTGSLGASAAGLKLLLNGARVGEATNEAMSEAAIRTHLRPEPRVEFGRRLGELGLATAMLDVSDGLAQDLSHICADSSVGAILDFDAVPVAEEVSVVTTNAADAFALAVSGGEDFELLFTANTENEAALLMLADECRLRLTRIGEIVPADDTPAIQLRRANKLSPLSPRGYDHFADR